MAGQMFVRLIELGDDKRLLASQRQVAFTDLSFEEAVAFWKERGGSQEMLDRILRGYRGQADAASQMMLDTLASKAIDQLETAIANGSSVAEFSQSMTEGAVSLGITPAAPGYLETVYRTNIATAYGAGRFRQITDPDVMAERPYVQYRTQDDGRERPSHALLDMTVYRSDTSEWKAIAPPNGFNCRCSMVTLSEEEAAQYGNVRESPPGQADPGFHQAPTEPLA